MKKLMPLCESLHVEMQFYMRQHFADRYWRHEFSGRHASGINQVLHEKTDIQMECSENAIRIE